MEHNLKSRHTF